MQTATPAVRTPMSTFLEALRTLKPEAAAAVEQAVPPTVWAALSGCDWSLAELMRRQGNLAAACQIGTLEESTAALTDFLIAMAEAARVVDMVCANAGVPVEQVEEALRHVGQAVLLAAQGEELRELAEREESEGLARLGYDAYGQQAGWKTFDGRPMPAWEGTGAVVQERWKAAAHAIASAVRGQK